MTTTVDEIAAGIFRISTAVDPEGIPGGFTFNQFLIRDDEPLLFHTGLRGLFEATRAAIATVLPPESLRYIGFSHFEADECGALNEFLAIAPHAVPVCSNVGAMTSVTDMADRAPRPMTDGESMDLGEHTVTWHDTPHLPHGWDSGYLSEASTKTLFCGDLFTQVGKGMAPVTEDDVLGPSEGMRSAMDYYAHGTNQAGLLEKLAATGPALLAVMHGSSWRGDGAGLLRKLGATLQAG